jgi:hypothetical protein
MTVSTSYEQSGRIQQKRRTRDQLIAATRELIAEKGSAPTVADAATAASMIAAHPETAVTSLVPPDAGDGVEERLRAAVHAFTAVIVDTESQQRTMLRLSLQPGTASDLPLRKGRAIGWFEDALAPLRERLSSADVHKLAVAIRSVVGIEALIWLTDVAGLTRAQATGLMQWSAQALLNEAITNDPPPT